MSSERNMRRPRFGEMDATARAQALPDVECRFVKVLLRLTNADGSANASGNLLFGDETYQSGEVTPGAWSDWIPCNNAREIYVRLLASDLGVSDGTVAFMATNAEVR